MSIRTRYAPSPTGDPHLGVLRTAIFDYLFAKQQGGTFILRLEDTDQSREKEGSDLTILESLRWLGIEPDEGLCLDEHGHMVQKGDFGPYIQSQRLDIYAEHIQKLLENGSAYRCFCTSERLEEMRNEQQKNHQPPRYDRRCRNLSKEESASRAQTEPFVIRQAMPEEGETSFVDVIRGEITFPNKDLDDQVLIKTDKFPTYQFANVVDDHLMQISHVIRGEEWIPSTPKNLLLYKAFGWDPPIFAHAPVILGPDGKHKLSKREGAEPVLSYRDQGYLPEAVLNFSTFLGWSPGTEEEFFTKEQLVERFQLEKVQKSAAIFNQERLDFVNGWYIRHLPVEKVVEHMLPYLKHAELVPVQEVLVPGDLSLYLIEVARTIQERLKYFAETASVSHFFFARPAVSPELLILIVPKKGDLATTQRILTETVDVLEGIKSWNQERIEQELHQFIAEHEYKNGEVLWPLRAALTGEAASPGAFEMLTVLGREESLARLHALLEIA